MIYDLIVIGGGPAGYTACYRAGEAGMKTLLIERGNIGGVCLNEGCIPTKALLYSAKIADTIRTAGKYGVVSGAAEIDQKAVLARKNKIVKILTSGVKSSVLKNCEMVSGIGKIVSKDDEGFVIEASGEKYRSRYLLLATGSETVIPRIDGLTNSIEAGYAITSREALSLETIPESMIVIGGGVIGLELASYFNSAGSKVTVIEMADKIGGGLDREIAEILMKNYRKKGIEFILGACVSNLENGIISYTKDESTEIIEADKIIVAVGRKPSVTGLGLENIGLRTEKGAVVTNEYCETGVEGVYAAGDINGVSMLAHTAYREAEVSVSNMIARKKERVNYMAIPAVIYTNPEASSVGETEESASVKGINIKSVKISMRYSGRYMAENEGGDGICKVLVRQEDDKVIGVHMLSNYSSELIYGMGICVDHGFTLEELKRIIFPHPTVGEVLHDAIWEISGERL